MNRLSVRQKQTNCYGSDVSTGEFSGRFGEFEITRRLGVGGMAETFEALRHGLGGFEQRVCLKRVLPAFSQDADFVRQFLHEAKLAATLRHSNVVGVIDFGNEDGTHYMALELVDGIDLRALLAQQPEHRLTAEQVALIGIDLAYALDFAHNVDRNQQGGGKGIVHRDVSPANVLISRAGEIKLADFGIAKAMNTAAATASRAIKGKIPYMAPEQMRGDSIDGRADLFSLGVLLFEAAAGVRPFTGAHDVEVMTRILEGDRLSLAERAPHLPAALCTAIENLLERDPEKRTPTADALLDDLVAVALSPQVRRELARWVESERGGVFTRDHVQEIRQIGATHDLLATAPYPIVDTNDTAAAIDALPERRMSKPMLLAAMAVAVLGVSIAGGRMMAGSDGSNEAVVVIDTRTGGQVLPDPDRVPGLAGETAADVAKVVQPSKKIRPARKTKRPSGSSKPTRTDSRSAKLRVVVIPRGSVWIDNKWAGEAPIQVPLSAGSHRIQAGFSNPTKTRTVTLKAGKSTRIEFDLDE